MNDPNARPPLRTEERTRPQDRQPVRCVVGDTLCEVRVWSDEEWECLDPADRPVPAEHVPGLGWVGAVLGRSPR